MRAVNTCRRRPDPLEVTVSPLFSSTLGGEGKGEGENLTAAAGLQPAKQGDFDGGDEMKKYKIGSGFAPFSPCQERFVAEGYRPAVSLEEQIKLASRVEGLSGIALDYPFQFAEKDAARVKSLLAETGMKFCTLELGIYPDRKWKMGSFCAPDPGIRREAVELSKKGLDMAALMKADDVLLWPGQDGFDYPFQADYRQSWKHLVEGIAEVASHNPDVKIGIEYKPKEPRTNIFVRNAGVLLYLLKCINMPNVGGVVDLGHSLVAGENPAEAAVLLSREEKLFSVHVNDNYRDWDHDMMVGAVSFWETLEFFYWLVKTGYNGWYIMDTFPYREDGLSALQRSVANSLRFLGMAEKLKGCGLEEAMKKMNAVGSSKILWETVFPEG